MFPNGPVCLNGGMKDKVNPLDPEMIEALKEDFETLTFPNDFDLVYENQVPATGVALLEGFIELTKGSKVKGKYSSGYILGLSQLLEDTPVKFGLRVKAKSKVILIGKSKFLECSRKKGNLLKKLLKG